MKNAILKVSLFFGLVCGIVAFLFFLLLNLRGMNALGSARNPDFLSALLFMVGALWYFRRMIRGGLLHFWEGLSVGFLTVLVGAVVSASLVNLFITRVDTGVLPRHLGELAQMRVARKEHYLALEKSEANFERMQAQIRQTTPSAMFWDEVLKKVLLVGLAPVLIASIVFRRQPYSLFNPGGPPEKKPD